MAAAGTFMGVMKAMVEARRFKTRRYGEMCRSGYEILARALYFRVRGRRRFRLPGLPGSEAFMEAYAMALAGM